MPNSCKEGMVARGGLSGAAKKSSHEKAALENSHGGGRL